MKVTIKQLCLWGAALLALIAFLMVFGAPLKMSYGSSSQVLTATEIYFGKSDGQAVGYSNAAPFVGFLFVLLAGAAAVVVPLVVKNEKLVKYILGGCAGLLLISAFMLFAVKSGWLSSMRHYLVKQGYSKSQAKDAVDTIKGHVTVRGAPVVAGLFAVLAAAGIAVPQFVNLDKVLFTIGK